MFWVDELVEQIEKEYPGKKSFILRDEKTLSGRVHIGSLRGVVIHAVVGQALREKGYDAKFIYEFNDADPMDGLPVYLDKAKYEEHMGKPLKDVPSPDSNAENFAMYFGNEFKEVIDSLHFQVEYTKASEKYKEGMYDKWLEKAMNHEADIRRIYKEVSGSEKPDDWHPLQVVCENCGKIGSTKVTGWDGKKANYKCMPDMVKWAKGCGHEGSLVPFGGVGKLPWKVEWAVKWAGYGVDIEGYGKDHAAAGGSHDVGEAICEQVLETHVPFKIPYEFFLVGGAKMSSSKGEGASARAVNSLLPPELVRFLMLKTYNQTIEFDPEGDTIPRLFDQYDETAEHYFGRIEEAKTIPDFQRRFYFSQPDSQNIKDHYRPRFSRLVFLVQMPHLDLKAEVEKMKGSPLTDEDKKELETRLFYVRKWLNEYAAEQYKFTISEEMPELAYDLSKDQERFLIDVAEILTNQNLSGEEVHAKIHEVRKNSPLKPRDAFAAIYMVLIGKDSGPQAGWFLDSLERDFVITRIKEAVALPEKEKPVFKPIIGKLLTIHEDVVEKFPGLKTQWALIEGVKIEKENPELEKFKQEVLKEVNAEDLKKNSAISAEFKAMYKQFGVDPSKRKPSSVALIDRIANGKDLYTINTLVDIYNVISIKYQLPFGAFNTNALKLPITLRFAKKGEIFTDMADEKDKPLDDGEMVYSDASGLIMARDFNHRDSAHTMISPNTTNLLLQVDGNAACDEAYVKAAFEECLQLILKYCGGEIKEREFLAA